MRLCLSQYKFIGRFHGNYTNICQLRQHHQMEETNGPGINVLNLQSLAVTLRTNRFNIKKVYLLSTECIFVFCVSQNTPRLFPYTAFTTVFVTEMESGYWTVQTGF
jgi:hypothetical protein